jgi:hypothetical protein
VIIASNGVAMNLVTSATTGQAESQQSFRHHLRLTNAVEYAAEQVRCCQHHTDLKKD